MSFRLVHATASHLGRGRNSPNIFLYRVVVPQHMTAVSTAPGFGIHLLPNERLANTRVVRDRNSKKPVAYIVIDRTTKYILLGQSVPLLVDWINKHISGGDQWERVTLTGFFENLNKTDGRNGGWHKGRYRIMCVPLDQARDLFERLRDDFSNVVVIRPVPGFTNIPLVQKKNVIPVSTHTRPANDNLPPT